jgi:hypothetical protein
LEILVIEYEGFVEILPHEIRLEPSSQVLLASWKLALLFDQGMAILEEE